MALTGRHRSAFVYVMEGTSEHVPVGKAEDIGKETILAALFQDLARREGVVRAFREGERLVEVEGRTRRAAAVVVEWELAGGAWWLAWRLFGTGEASVGVFHGDRLVREGTTFDELDEPFREWLDRATATIETKRQQLALRAAYPTAPSIASIARNIRVESTISVGGLITTNDRRA